MHKSDVIPFAVMSWGAAATQFGAGLAVYHDRLVLGGGCQPTRGGRLRGWRRGDALALTIAYMLGDLPPEKRAALLRAKERPVRR